MTSHENLVHEMNEDITNLKVMIANLEIHLAKLDMRVDHTDITLVMADKLEELADSVMTFATYPYKTLLRNGVVRDRNGNDITK